MYQFCLITANIMCLKWSGGQTFYWADLIFLVLTKNYEYGDVNMTSQHFIVCHRHNKDRCGIASQHAKVSLMHNGPFSILGQCSAQFNWTHEVYIKVLDGLKSSARLGAARVGLQLQADPSGFISIQKTKQLQLLLEVFIKNSNCQP